MSRRRLRIALINPPISEHKFRGVGLYTENLYKFLKEESLVKISLQEINSDLSEFDILHYPYFDPFFLTLPLFKKKPTVVTIHDLIPLKFPKFFPPGVRGAIKWQIQKMALKNTSAIITDSFSSEEDVIKFTGVNEEKIHVIYLGVGEEFKVIKSRETLDSLRRKLKLPEEFILHVGDVNHNKNIPGIIEAFKVVSKSNPLFHLVLVGNGFVTPSKELSEVVQLIKVLGIENKVYRLDHITINELVGLYNLAKVYVQASFAEGFGLPVLEAMACGCPVIASNASSLPELVDNAGTFVNPSNHREIAHKIIVLFQDKEKREKLSRKGLVRSRLFTWKECANRTVDVYKKISA